MHLCLKFANGKVSKCREHRILHPYLKVAAAPLTAEVAGVGDLRPGLLEAIEAVQLHSDLARGPQSQG